jgi:hypothetical protein|tara:strand:- start:907 stop:1224 length:318 start_codon:yes stop_codon:yes gene_type:complete
MARYVNFSEKQKILIELCVRNMLCNLLNREERDIKDFTAILHNINIGAFGKKTYKFKDTNNWIACLQDLRDILEIIDPIYHKQGLEMGDKPYKLEEEENLTKIIN